MSFVSLEFLLLLLSLFVLYFLSAKLFPKLQWGVLLLASVIFYYWVMREYTLYLMLYILTAWLCGISIEKIGNKYLENRINNGSEEEKQHLKIITSFLQKLTLTLAIILMLGCLLLVKCKGFFLSDFPEGAAQWLIMPLGISFFAFLNIGYCVDIYRGTAKAENNPLKYALYVSYFPHILQGPLDRFDTLSPQLFSVHDFSGDKFKSGLERMLIGYFKKLAVANNLGMFVDSTYAVPSERSGIVLVLATLAYAMQIYADFSGYMDIVCGISECLGIRIEENFKTPYFSESIAEYWRRWHITLGAWFRDYLYYPILRSEAFRCLSKRLRSQRKKKLAKILPTSLGLLITWFLIGFWHGNSWNFIVHGLYHGCFIISSTMLADFYGTLRTKSRISEDAFSWHLFKKVRTFLLVCIGYVFFRADSLRTALTIYKRIFSDFFYEGWSIGFYNEKFDAFFWIAMLVLALLIVMLDIVSEKKGNFVSWLNRQKLPLRWCILYFLMLSTLCMIVFSDVKAAGAGNFIYYNF